MLQRSLLTLFIILSSACANGPKVTVCILDAANKNLQCQNADGVQSVVDLAHADKYVCLSPDDTERLLEWAKKECTIEK